MKSNIKSFYRKKERAEKREKLIDRQRVTNIRLKHKMKKVFNQKTIESIVYQDYPFQGLFKRE